MKNYKKSDEYVKLGEDESDVFKLLYFVTTFTNLKDQVDDKCKQWKFFLPYYRYTSRGDRA